MLVKHGQIEPPPANLKRPGSEWKRGQLIDPSPSSDDMAKWRGMKYSYSSGSQPFDGYTIKRGVGIGGFGEVYFAVSQAGKEVALKKIQRNLDIELRGVQQCLNLKHVNLISLWDIRSNQYGESWVVMEYVPGPSLRDVVEAYPDGMPEDQIKAWFTAIASGVAYLHEKGIVHRDLKPGNIFCDEHAHVVKIGDYGLSKFISCSRRSGNTESVGTFHYMAPEIGKGIYGKEIDIYALGIVLFEMLTGTVPFEGESAQEIIMKHLTADPDISSAPEPFRTVIRTALRKDPQHRYADVHELLQDLPWQDVVENSHKIVSWHTVGSMIKTGNIPRASHAYPTDIHPVSQSQSRAQDTEDSNEELVGITRVDHASPVIIDDSQVGIVVPDIQFGPLQNEELLTTKLASTDDTTVAEDPVQVLRTTVYDTGADIQGANLSLSSSNDSFTVSAQVVDAMEVPPAPSNHLTGPMSRIFGRRFPRFSHWWDSGSVNTPVKMMLLAIAGIIAIKQSDWLLPAALAVGLIYLLYYWLVDPFFKSNFRKSNAGKTLSKKELKRQQIVATREWVHQRPAADRFTELIGSLLGSAISCVVLSFLGLALSGRFLNPSLESWSIYLWLILTGIACCWTTLLAGKRWEHHDGHAAYRRIAMLLTGFAVGVFAFTMGSFLEMKLTAIRETGGINSDWVIQNIAPLTACVLLFSGLFGLLRLWRQADPTRRTRVSIWSVGLLMMWSIVLGHVLNLPTIHLCILALSVSVSIQFASPWVHPEQQRQICSGS